MKFLFRCDVSPEIGAGHLRRCAVLASELRRRGAWVVFSYRSEHVDPAADLLGAADECMAMEWSLPPEADAREVGRLCRRNRADAAVIDCYRRDEKYQILLLNERIRWLQFDWAAQEPLWADWVLNPSPAAEEKVYRKLARRKETRLMLGPSYALLRPEFRPPGKKAAVRERPLLRQGSGGRVKRILITLGGGGDRGGTILCLEAVRRLGEDKECTVLMGSFNPHIAHVEEWIRKSGLRNVIIIPGERDVARRMAEADIGIIGGGTTTFEAAAMGLPCVIIQIAENQSLNAVAWGKAGVALEAGPLAGLTPDILEFHIRRLTDDAGLRRAMSSAGIALVDGRGAERVADALTGKG